MEDHRFDAALRALGAGTTRRRGIASAFAVLLGGGIAGADASRKRPAPAGPCGDGSAADNRCSKDSQCCTKYCADGSCRCKPNWMECSKGAHCCSGSCLDGRCDGGCKPAETRCQENFNCCNGLACIDGVCAESKKAKCNSGNCPGCCDGTVCRVGTRLNSCGAGGAACAYCGAGATCASGICVGPCGLCSSLAPVTCGGTCTASANWSVQSTIGDNANPIDGVGLIITGNGLMAISSNTPISPQNPSLVQVWTRPSASSATWTVAAALSGFNNANTFALSPDNLTLWATDSAGDEVFVLTRPSVSSTAWVQQAEFTVSSGPQVAPQGIAVSPDGLTFWIADFFAGAIQQWSRPNAASTTWTQQTTFGSTGSALGNLNNPKGVAVSRDTLTVWVADCTNHRVSVWTRSDAASTTWTNAYTFGSQGTGANQLQFPTGLALSCDGLTLYVADSANLRVSIWTRPDAASPTWTNANTTAITGTVNAVSLTASGLALAVTETDYGNGYLSRGKVWTLAC